MLLRRIGITCLHRQNHSTVVKTKAKPEIWESVIGLEVHAQIQANTKLFSPCGADFGAPVNTLVSPFDASIPGTLPVLNRKCVEAAVATALALSCNINMTSLFDRKHYFYADLPAGYQITQQRKAIAENGEINFLVMVPDKSLPPYYKTCRIRQLQLEQDSGKSLHDQETERSLIDLNRAGLALMEIVFQPDLSSGEEAAALVKELCLILQALNACSCRMEEGALRVDANVSVNKKGEGLGTRTEIKNLSSLRSLVYAVEYEIKRQIEVLESGGTITNETRSFDANHRITLSMRDKEVQQDYRFMPEPNLPPLILRHEPDDQGDDELQSQVNVARVKKEVVDCAEFPEDTRQRLIKTYSLTLEKAHIITSLPGLKEYYGKVMSHISPDYGNRAANFLQLIVLEQLYDRQLNFTDMFIPSETIAEFVMMIENRQIRHDISKDLLKLLFDGDQRPVAQIVKDQGWLMNSDDEFINEICRRVIEKNPKIAENYRLKKTPKFYNKLMGLAKKETNVVLDMKKVSDYFKNMLENK